MVEVVRRANDGHPLLLAELVKEFKKLYLMVDIEMGGWFVEEQHLRSLTQGSGDDHPLALSAGHLQNVAIRQMNGSCTLHYFIDDALVIVAQQLEAADIGVSAHGHDLADREGERDGRLLWHNRALAGDLSPRQSVKLLTTEVDGARSRPDDPGHRPQERRLAAPVRADQSREGTFIYPEINLLDNTLACPVTSGHRVDLERGLLWIGHVAHKKSRPLQKRRSAPRLVNGPTTQPRVEVGLSREGDTQLQAPGRSPGFRLDASAPSQLRLGASGPAADSSATTTANRLQWRDRGGFAPPSLCSRNRTTSIIQARIDRGQTGATGS